MHTTCVIIAIILQLNIFCQGFPIKYSTLCFTLCTIITLLLPLWHNYTYHYMRHWDIETVAKCRHNRRENQKNACRRTHRGCHEGEESPCTYLLVVSMTWIWSSWDQHRVYQWNCGVGDDIPCPPATQILHHSTRIWSPRKLATFSCHQESLRPHSGACCDGLPPVPGPDSDSLTNLIWLRVKLSTQHRKFAQANSYRWLDQWHGFTLVIVLTRHLLRLFWVTKKGPIVKLEKEACHTGCKIIQPVINQNLRDRQGTCT